VVPDATVSFALRQSWIHFLSVIIAVALFALASASMSLDHEASKHVALLSTLTMPWAKLVAVFVQVSALLLLFRLVGKRVL
jgi:ABC-type lipoprotein release transport system permease subunit